MSGMGSHQSARMVSDTWLTPPQITAELGPFGLDPCAAPEPRPWPTAARHITLPEDGLAADWGSERVWLNPPYSREAVKWIRRLAVHGRGTALIFARTETAWFAEAVWQKATAARFLHGRLYFHHADGRQAKANAGAPSVLVAYGEEDAARLRDCDLAGTFVRWQVSGRSFLQGSLFDSEAQPMSDDGGFAIYVRPCAECGQQTATSSLCLRTDLCPACFAESLTVTPPKEG